MIEVKGLNKRYQGVHALRDLDVSVDAGAIGLLGPNGAGKSTFIKSLMGLVSYQTGSIKVLGLDARRQAREIRQKIGYMPEDDCFLPHLKGVEAIRYMGELAGLPTSGALGRAHEVCDFVGLGEERYREMHTYSMGMRQKAKLAQALTHDPDILILDEPSNGLAPASRERMLELIEYLRKEHGKTILLSTHLLHDVEQICDHVVILGGGRKLLQGDIAELTKSRDDCVNLTVQGDRQTFSAALEAEGMTVEQLKHDNMKVRGTEAARLSMAVAARSDDAVIRRLRPERSSLENVFLAAIEGRTPTADEHLTDKPMSKPTESSDQATSPNSAVSSRPPDAEPPSSVTNDR
jgi:ABC-2 type transport system ATP-binding protein